MTDSIDVGESLNIPLSEWRPRYEALEKLKKEYRVFVANAATVKELCVALSPVLQMRVEVIEAVLKLEFTYPERATYRSAATRDDGSKLYRGITQASQGFWTDVVEHAAARGFKISARSPENASLFEQIAAPFIYLDRYRSSVKGHRFTAAMIYALHQQGPGAARGGFAAVAGNQNSRSLAAVRVAQAGAAGQPMSHWL